MYLPITIRRNACLILDNPPKKIPTGNEYEEILNS